MKKKNIEYLVSAVRPEQWPIPDRPEIILVGRSNAGKSSLINSMWGKPVAFVSSQPGRTNVLNFYNVGDSYRVVDTPGYGFARKKSEIEASLHGMDDYLSHREALRGLLLIADVKREPEEDEEWIATFCKGNQISSIAVLNKSDKLNQKERNQQKKKWGGLGMPIFLVSAQDGSGVDELEKWVFDNWLK